MKSSPRKIIALKAQHWLDVGCGPNKQAGAVGMDRRKLEGVDVVHDIEDLPWPFADESFDKILCSHILEHLKPWLMVDLMDEMWRVLKPKGLVMIAMPYAGSFGFYQDPTHVKAWNEATAQYFDPNYPLYKVYEPKPWSIQVNSWKSDGTLEIVLAKSAA